ncbi:hypothetical protein V8C40DRAFT_278898 [Trichoderma camerunense]
MTARDYSRISVTNRSFPNCRCALRKLRSSWSGWAGMIAARCDGRQERQRHTRGQSTSAAHAPSRLYDVPRYKRLSSSRLLRNNFCLISPCFLSFFHHFLARSLRSNQFYPYKVQSSCALPISRVRVFTQSHNPHTKTQRLASAHVRSLE